MRALTAVIALALLASLAVAAARSTAPARAAGEVTFDFSLSSDHSTRHPDLRVTIENHSAGDITSTTVGLPDGFMGSLNATPDGSDPGSDPDRCPWIDDAADFAANCTGDLRTNSRIGTVKNYAHLDNAAGANTTVLDGAVYLTERNPAHSEDAAGMVIVVDAKVSAMDLGKVVVPARMKLRPNESTVIPFENVLSPEGMDTIVESIPTTILDPDHGTINFTIDKIVMDIMGDPPGGASPLLYAPGDCSAPLSVDASFGTTDPGAPTVLASDAVTMDDCDKVAFTPVNTKFDLSSYVSGDYLASMDIKVEFPVGNATTRMAVVDLPRTISSNAAANRECLMYDDGGTPTVEPHTISTDPETTCADNTMLGTATVTTPLLTAPVTGTVIGEDSPGSLPALYMVFKDPSIGLDTRLRGLVDVVKTGGGTTVATADFIRTTLNLDGGGAPANLPSMPINSLEINLRQEPAGYVFPDSSVSGGMLMYVGNGPACMDTDTARFYMDGWNGVHYETTGQVKTFTGCPRNFTEIIAGPADGEVVTTSSASFTVQNNDSVARGFSCSFDDGSKIDAGEPDWGLDKAISGINPQYTPATSGNLNCGKGVATTAAGGTLTRTYDNLEDGKVYKFLVQNSSTTATSDQDMRVFSVDLVPDPIDSTNPSVTIDSGPVDPTPTSDTTPTWSFSGTDDTTAAADVEYQCSLDGAAFRPCGSGASESFTPTSPLTVATLTYDPEHTFAVRSEDEWGNVSTPATRDFTIEVPFGPAVDVTPTTTPARSHPTMSIDLTNDATADIKNFNFSMPDGFMGSLLGAAAQCTIAQAEANACPPGSKIGTVDTTAQVDQSLITMPGDIYLTDPLQAGDPAGMAVIVEGEVGDVDLQNDIVVKTRLAIRGVAEGLDAFSENLPRVVHDNTKNVDVTFRVRRLELELTGNVGGSQPFMWAPSGCEPKSYEAGYRSYDDVDTQQSIPFTVTGCESLDFNTDFSASLTRLTGEGPPSVKEAARFAVRMTAAPGDAAIKLSQVTLPKTLTIDLKAVPDRICERYEAAVHNCPDVAITGSATVHTPLLPAPLTGPAYMTRGDHKNTPDITIALRGLISVDLLAKNTFVNGTQVYNEIDTIPDTPLTSFELVVDKLIAVHPDACTVPIEKRGLEGTATATNNKTDSLSTPPLPVNCKDDLSIVSAFKNRGAKSTLNVSATANGLHPKIKRLNLRLPKGLKMNRKALKKKLKIRGDGRTLKSACWRFKSPTVLDVKLCRKKYGNVRFLFGSGSLSAKRTVKASARMSIKVTSASGAPTTVKPPLSARRYPPL